MLARIALSIIRFHLFESNRNVSRRASSGSNRRYRSPILGDKAVPAWLPRWKNDLSIAFFDNVYSRVKLQRKIENRSREHGPTIRSLFPNASPRSNWSAFVSFQTISTRDRETISNFPWKNPSERSDDKTSSIHPRRARAILLFHRLSSFHR